MGSACSPTSPLLTEPSLLLPFFLCKSSHHRLLLSHLTRHSQETAEEDVGMAAFQIGEDIGKFSAQHPKDHQSHFQLHRPHLFCAPACSPPLPPKSLISSPILLETKAFSLMLDEFQDCPTFLSVCYSDTPTSPSVNICIFLLLCNRYQHTRHLKTTEAPTVSGSP